MTNEPTDEQVNLFLARVIEIEERYAFVRRGQESARKEDLKTLLDNFCK